MVMNPDSSVHREFKLLGIIISSIAYGIIIVLSGRCFLLLFQKKSSIYSNRKQFFLLSYVAVMFCLSTLLIFQEIVGITFEIFKPLDLNSPSIKFTEWSPVHLLLTMWGADGLMVSILLDLQPNKDLQCDYRYGAVSSCIRAYQEALGFW